MKNTALKDILRRAENWPAENREELLRAALYIEQRRSGDFTLTADDRKIIATRLEAAKLGAISTDEEVDTIIGSLTNMRNKTTLGGHAWKTLRDTNRK